MNQQKPNGNSGWQTPAPVFDALAKEFGPFDLDPASAHTAYSSTKVRRYCTPEGTFANGRQVSRLDGLNYPWKGRVWVNPPYKNVGPWVARGADAGFAGALVVMLLMPSVDSRWFHACVWDSLRHQPREGVQVRFLQGRIRFVHPDPEQRTTAFKGFRPISGNMIVVFGQ